MYVSNFIIYTATISSAFTFGMTCWFGNDSKQDKSRLDKNIKKTGGVGGVVVRRQENTDTANCHRLLRTISADETRPLKPEFDNRQSKRQI